MFSNPRHEADKEARARAMAEHEEKAERRALEEKAATFTPGATCESRNHQHRCAAVARAHLDVSAKRERELETLRQQIGDVERAARAEAAEATKRAADTRAKLELELAEEIDRVLYPIAVRFADDPWKTSKELLETWIVLDVRAQAELGAPISARHLAIAFAAAVGGGDIAGHPHFFEGETGAGAWAERLVFAIKQGVAVEVHAAGIELLRAIWRAHHQLRGAGSAERVAAMKRAITHTAVVQAHAAPAPATPPEAA